MSRQIATQDALHALFHPRAVAVIGASDDTTKHGYIVLTNVRDTGFPGGIYGISRRLKTIDGIPCFPDLTALPEPVDTAFLAIPAEATLQAVRDCAQAGMKAVIVGSAGYAESLDAGGAERQRELQRIAQQEGIRIVGPNCNGIYNAHRPLSIGFNTAHAKRQPPGGISIFSHSGALFDAMAGRLATLGAGLSLFASAGNEADLSVLDYMEYALAHAPTKVIALLIDSLDDGPRFRRLALAAHAAGKHVVALKIGGSKAGAAAAVAHSSRMAGDGVSYHALFKASGVATVSSLEGFMTAAALLEKYGSHPGKLGALSTSGAGASLIADRCEALGVPLAPLTPQTHAAIDAHKMFSRIGNPLDMGIFGGMKRSAEVPTLLMADAEVSVGLALVHSMNPWQGDPYRAAMGTARQQSGKPLLLVSPGGMPDAERATYLARGIDIFTETDILLEGIGALLTPPPEPISQTEPAHPTPTLPQPRPDRTRKPAPASHLRRPNSAIDRMQRPRRRHRRRHHLELSGRAERHSRRESPTKATSAWFMSVCATPEFRRRRLRRCPLRTRHRPGHDHRLAGGNRRRHPSGRRRPRPHRRPGRHLRRGAARRRHLPHPHHPCRDRNRPRARQFGPRARQPPLEAPIRIPRLR